MMGVKFGAYCQLGLVLCLDQRVAYLKTFFYLILQLQIAAREHEVYIRTYHLSGNRMIATRMDW